MTGKDIGKQIKKRREAIGLSVEGLSYKAGVSYKTIERIEGGYVETPRRATLAVVEHALAREELKAAA